MVETIQEELSNMIIQLESMLKDAHNFDNGTKAAGVRVRKGLNNLKKDCLRVRQEIQARKVRM